MGMNPRFPFRTAVLSWAILALSCSLMIGCTPLVINGPLKVDRADAKASYPPLPAKSVCYFPSKSDFPKGMAVLTVGTISSVQATSYFSYKDFLKEVRKAAGKMGANVLVLERATTELAAPFHTLFKGTAKAYRLYLKDPSETVDVSGFPNATMEPPEPKVPVLRTYQGISSQEPYKEK